MSGFGITDAERIRRIVEMLDIPAYLVPWVRQALHELSQRDLHIAFTSLGRNERYLANWQTAVARAKEVYLAAVEKSQDAA